MKIMNVWENYKACELALTGVRLADEQRHKRIIITPVRADDLNECVILYNVQHHTHDSKRWEKISDHERPSTGLLLTCLLIVCAQFFVQTSSSCTVSCPKSPCQLPVHAFRWIINRGRLCFHVVILFALFVCTVFVFNYP